MNNQKKEFTRFILVLATFAGAVLLLFEACLRIPGFVQDFRNEAKLKEHGAYRILCLGESTTEGQYPAFLEQELNARKTGITFRVIDKGASGRDSTWLMSHLGEYLDRYRPDMVIAMMGVGDDARLVPFSEKRWRFAGDLRTCQFSAFLLSQLRTNAKSFLTRFLRPGALREETDPRAREKMLRADARHHPDDPVAETRLGLFLCQTGRLFEAREIFEKLHERAPGNGEAALYLGYIAGQMKNWERAEALFTAASSNSAAAARVYEYWADACMSASRFAEAEPKYRKAVQIAPGDRTLQLKLSHCLTSQSKLAEAERYLEKYAAAWPGDIRGHAALGNVYKLLKKHDRAERCFGEAARLWSSHYSPATISNYRHLIDTLTARKIVPVVMQYPLRSIEPLKALLGEKTEIIFIDNGEIFRNALKNGRYGEYFRDNLQGDSGHCTDKGNRLLAEHVANSIIGVCLRQAKGDSTSF